MRRSHDAAFYLQIDSEGGVLFNRRCRYAIVACTSSPLDNNDCVAWETSYFFSLVHPQRFLITQRQASGFLRRTDVQIVR